MDLSINATVGLLLLALPAGFVFVAHRVLHSRLLMWCIVALTWAAALWFWVDYNRQTNDVGLMVSGIVAYALSGSALAATIVAAFIERRR